jgi:Universal stress protein family
MATHGRGAIHNLFFGSVTEAVVRNAVCPVLTLRPAAVPEPNPEAAKPAKAAKPATSAKKKPGAPR